MKSRCDSKGAPGRGLDMTKVCNPWDGNVFAAHRLYLTMSPANRYDCSDHPPVVCVPMRSGM
eukprot:15447766-Alexandrium_andersonii.AAC.1